MQLSSILLTDSLKNLIQVHPYAKAAHSALLAVPKVRLHPHPYLNAF